MSILVSKAVDVQYVIVGACQNLEKQVHPDYNVGLEGTAALTKLNTFFTFMRARGYSVTRAGTAFKKDGALLASLFSALSKISKTGYVALTGTGMPLNASSSTAFDSAFTALQSAFVAATDAAA